MMKEGELRGGNMVKKLVLISNVDDDSAYDEVRRKSGPKRGYVKALEARLGEFLEPFFSPGN